jgi:hypothetical protein
MKNSEVFLSLTSIMVILIAGCIGSQAPQPDPAVVTPSIATTATTTIIPTTTATARPTICRTQAPGVVECLYTDIIKTTALTTTPTKMQTTSPLVGEITVGGAFVEEISGPLATPVTLTGLGNQIVWFEAAHPGVVTLKIRPYSGPQEVKNCEVTRSSIMLAGKSIDQNIPMGVGLSQFTRTATLPSAGRYSLTVKSCYTWEITVS